MLEVADQFRPECGGRYRLIGGPDGATCQRTEDPADLVIPIEHLGAAYLGAPRLASLGWLGLVKGDPEALALAHLMFAWQPPPEVSVHF